MLPGLSALIGNPGIAVPAKLTAGENLFDTNGDGVADFKRIGKTDAVGSWDVQPFTGFTINNFYDEYDASGVYSISRVIVTGTDASAVIPDYKALSIGASKRAISWTVNSSTQVTYSTTSQFSFSNGGVFSILFEGDGRDPYS